jgi:hypothetical protein
MAVAQAARQPHIVGAGGDRAVVALDRFDHHRRKAVAVTAEGVFQALAVVHRRQVAQRPQVQRNPPRPRPHLGLTPAGHPVLQVDRPERGVEEAMITALDQQVAVAPGMCAGQTQRRHHRLGARVREAHQVHARHHAAQPVGDLVLGLGRQREHAAHLHAAPRGLVHARIGVAQDRRTIAHAVVDVFVAVDVPHARALAAPDVDGPVLAPVAEGRGHAERKPGVGLLPMRVRARKIAVRVGLHVIAFPEPPRGPDGPAQTPLARERWHDID